jgi:peroxiredoxin Q/BCP
VLGVSGDTPAAQKKFKEKYDLPFTLLADPDKKVAKLYGVLKDKSMYGKIFKGIERTTFLIDRNGRIAKIFSKVRAQGHAEEVMAVLREG